jgi:mono/diheme cytochrome c family protein
VKIVDRVLEGLVWAGFALLIVLLFAGPSLIGAEAGTPVAAQATPAPATTPTATATPEFGPADGEEEEEPAAEETPAATEPPAPAADGSAVFSSAGCGGCHTLAAAGSNGAVGPNLDQARPDAARVEAIVRSGSGAMPAFEGQLSDDEIKAVAAFVAGG